MDGCNNSLWSRLKAVSPFCVQLKCICYSLVLCIQYAVSNLPSNIEFLLSEIPSWFHLVNWDEKLIKNCLEWWTQLRNLSQPELPPFENPSFTRWLVRGKVIFRILMNWEELKAYFTSAKLAQSQFDTKFKGKLLNVPTNILTSEETSEKTVMRKEMGGGIIKLILISNS